MRMGWRVATVAGLVVLGVLAAPSLADASLGISVPAAVNLGSVPSGTRSLSARLGVIIVNANGLVAPSFTATVSSTAFITGAGGAAQTIGNTLISYWSGPTTASAGLQTATPGQVDAAHAEILSVSRTAFSSSGLVLTISTSWNPTIVIGIPAAAVAGTYSATITHSVA